MANKLLIISSTTFLFPLYYAHTMAHQLTPTQHILCILLFCNYIISCLFWWNPIRHGIIHRVDSFFAKLAFISYSMYILLHKYNTVFVLVLWQCVKMYKYSAQYSAKEWCCNSHIICHAGFHILVSVGSTFAFISHPSPKNDLNFMSNYF